MKRNGIKIKYNRNLADIFESVRGNGKGYSKVIILSNLKTKRVITIKISNQNEINTAG